jgi:hypothetical protein
MRALGDLLIILGLTVAAFASGSGNTLDDAGAPPAANAVASRGIQASAIPDPPVSQTVYVSTRRTTAVPPATATQELGLDLVRELQHELMRVGCYEGDINGIWTASTRQALEALVGQLNAKLPTALPEPAHLALVQGQQARICNQCPPGDENQSRWRCGNPVKREVLAASIAPSSSQMAEDLPKLRSEQSLRRGRRGPTEDRLGLGVSSERLQTARVDANRRVANHTPSSRHRAIRHGHRTLVAHRPMRPTRYAYHRPLGLFALLFGW